MDNIHPKRKKAKDNNYILIKNEKGYFVIILGSDNTCIQIDEEIYNLLNLFELEDISYLNKVSRHYEHILLSETNLNVRTSKQVISIEDEIIKKQEYAILYEAINTLSKKQKRRLIMYYFQELTYQEIADIEHCKHTAIIKSIRGAQSQIKKYFTEKGYNS